MEPVITLKNISKTFVEYADHSIPALNNISLEIISGEIFVVVGPSGSGKSTLLRIMSGLEKKYDGEVILHDGLVPEDFSFVFQQFALLPWLTVSENIAIGLVARTDHRHVISERVNKELKRFGLEKFGHAYPRELSGGMRQRVGIARALATDPRVIFMDEPFSELDSFTAQELRKELLRIWQNPEWGESKKHMQEQPTIVMVTHIVEEALELADRVAVLTPRPGKIEKIVKNNLLRPRALRSQEFFAAEDELYRLIKP
ncbi:MAG: ABC transporter ATP-binding protein [Candidatus Sungbacteria bacterium]|nr:ABC transporter ATP-binding protein [bacterium]MDZ4260261.1 ABC transporter ATP-binding protein [Candidatus Sungbacteria bacterium]